MERKCIWYILSNKSDVGNLSIYKFLGTREECSKKLKALIMLTAANAEPNEISLIRTDDLTGQIIYRDDAVEEFRCISISDVTPIDEVDDMLNFKLEKLPEELDMDATEVNKIIHCI